MLLNKNVTFKCNNRNKQWLSNLIKCKIGDTITIPIEYLPLNSSVEVEYLCDYCYLKGTKTYLKNKYSIYLDRRKNIPKDCCKKCSSEKFKEVFLLKYGTNNPGKVDSIQKKRAESIKTSVKEIEKLLADRNCTFCSELYTGDTYNIPYICNKHYNYGTQYVWLQNLKSGRLCTPCGNEKRAESNSGSNSHFWKGGVTETSVYFRFLLDDWKRASKEFYNYKCIITGSSNFQIHHLYSFNKILDEMFIKTNISRKKYIKDYSSEELDMLVQMFYQIHENYPLGVLISKDIHEEFHRIYGKDVLEDDFKRFLKDNYAYNLELHYINDGYCRDSARFEKYFPYKINTSSKYTGVTFVKTATNLKWKAVLCHGNYVHSLGYYKTEYEAALAYNNKSIELFGNYARINKLDENDKPLNYEHSLLYYDLKDGLSSKYTGVHLDKNNVYVARFTFAGERITVGYYSSELEAAYYYNKKILEYNEKYNTNMKINYLTEWEIAKVEDDITYFPAKKKSGTPFSCVFFTKGKWASFFKQNGVYHRVGTFSTDLEAAIAYNNYVINNHIQRKLNKIPDTF